MLANDIPAAAPDGLYSAVIETPEGSEHPADTG